MADNLAFSARVNKSDGRDMPDPATQQTLGNPIRVLKAKTIRQLCIPNDHASLFAPRQGPWVD
jgi:hypothetical protein